jgi:acetoacetate decarboxylase
MVYTPQGHPMTPFESPRPPLRRLVDMLAIDDWIYRDAHYLAAEMEIDAVAAARWLPSPLRLASPATATLFTAWFPTNTFGSVYREAGIFLHVEHRGARAIHSPWMLVDDDVALITGRELLGYPKKMGEITWSLEGDRVTSVATRRGAELVRMEATLGAKVESPPPILGRPHRNIRSALGLALPQVIAFTPKERVIEVRHADVRVTVGGSTRDPIAELGFGPVRAAYLHRVDLGASGLPLPVAIASPLGFARQLLKRIH